MDRPRPVRPHGRHRDDPRAEAVEAWAHARHGHPHAGPGGPLGRLLFGRGPRVRRGDVRAAALVLLAEMPRNGYQLMQEIESRSGGMWRPSPGSIYPVLQQLEDEGLVQPQGPEGRRLYQLTDEGRTYVDGHAAELGEPWATLGEGERGAAGLRDMVGQVALAASLVSRAGGPAQLREAQQVLSSARRSLYRILAEEGGE